MATLDNLKAALAELNQRYPRPDMPCLALSEPCDVRDSEASWPHAGERGVYAFLDGDMKLLYVGKASCQHCLGLRLGAHFYKDGTPKKDYFKDVRYATTIPVPKERAFEAAAVEEFLICALNPPLNVVGRSSDA